MQQSAATDTVTFSSDGKHILVGCQDGVTRMWETATGESIGMTLRHDSGIRSVAFCADCRVAMTIDRDNTVTLWAISTGKRIGKPRFLGNARAVALSPDRALGLAACADDIRWFEVLPSLEGDPDEIALRISVLTGMEVDDMGEVRYLPKDEWEHRGSSIHGSSIKAATRSSAP